MAATSHIAIGTWLVWLTNLILKFISLTLINSDANSSHGCWLPHWPAQQNCILFLGMPSSPESWGFPHENHFWLSLYLAILTLQAFSLSLSSVANIAWQHYVTSSGLQGTGPQFIEMYISKKKACNCYWCLFPDTKVIPKPNADAHVLDMKQNK